MCRSFPVVRWGQRRVTFRPAEQEPPGKERLAAALVFAFDGSRVLLADIAGRGWCIPGGRIEPGETAGEAARREAWEECGASLGLLIPAGHTLEILPYDAERRLAFSYVTTVLAIGPIPVHSESRGIRMASLDELPNCYYQWDELVASMFDYAWDLRLKLPATG